MEVSPLSLRRLLCLTVEVVVAALLQGLPRDLLWLPLPWEGRPAFLALVVLDSSLRDGPVAGACTGFLTGWWTDLAAGNLLGAGAGAWLLAGYGVGLLGTYLFRERWEVPAVLVPAGTLAGATLELLFGSIWHAGPALPGLWLQTVMPAVLYNSFLSVLIYGLMHRWFWRPRPVVYRLGERAHGR